MSQRSASTAATDRHAGPATSARRLATIAMAGFAAFIAIYVAFHFIQPELDPLRRFGSEYAAGRAGWLMVIAFFALAVGLAAQAWAFERALRPARSRAATVLFLIGAVGTVGSGVFTADLQGTGVTRSGILHDLSGFVMFLSLIPAILILSHRLRRHGRLRGGYRALLPVAWLVLALFLAALFLIPLPGLGQRLFLAAFFAWLLVTAAGLRAGAFAREGHV